MLQVNNNSPSFKARPLSKVLLRSNSGSSPIVIYELGKKDEPFLRKMINKIRLDELCVENKKRQDLIRWKELLFRCYEDLRYNTVLLAVKDKKPCAIMSFMELFGRINLSNIAAIPVKKDTYAKCAGKSLLRELFEQAQSKNALAIGGMVDSGEPHIVKFYKDAGFKIDANILSYKKEEFYQKATAKMDNFLEYIPVKNPKEVNLNKKCSLNFKPTVFDKLKGLFTKN